MQPVEYIDINCDVGEGVGNEAQLLPLISSCNIACGAHAGDARTMANVVRLAKKHTIKIGAHPSYPDRTNFGRVSMDIPDTELIQSLQSQMQTLMGILERERVALHHIKPHGALYNDLAKSEFLSTTFLKAIAKYRGTVWLYLPPNSVIAEIAKKQGYQIQYEAFADRNYNADSSLVSRALPSALLTVPEEVLSHLLSMVKDKAVLAISGKKVRLNADTYCIHGDTENALQIIMYLAQELPNHQIQIKK